MTPFPCPVESIRSLDSRSSFSQKPQILAAGCFTPVVKTHILHLIRFADYDGKRSLLHEPGTSSETYFTHERNQPLAAILGWLGIRNRKVEFSILRPNDSKEAYSEARESPGREPVSIVTLDVRGRARLSGSSVSPLRQREDRRTNPATNQTHKHNAVKRFCFIKLVPRAEGARIPQLAGLRKAAPSILPAPDSCTKATIRTFFGSVPGLSFN